MLHRSNKRSSASLRNGLQNIAGYILRQVFYSWPGFLQAIGNMVHMKRIGILAVSTLLLLGVSCSKKSDNNNNNTTTTSGTAQVNMHLTDGPGVYDHVYIDIQQ